MDVNTEGNGGGNIPLLGGPTEQKLVITFSKAPDGTGNIQFHFEPDIIEAISPEQQAAINVANGVIAMFNLDRQGEQNAESSDTRN